jgi:hypothetical protein
MRLTCLVTIVGGVLVGTSAHAATCLQRAEKCVQKGMGFACYGNSRMAACAVSDQYQSPDGSSSEANGIYKGKLKPDAQSKRGLKKSV